MVDDNLDDLNKWCSNYAQYCYTARADSEQFYHLDFMAVLQTISGVFLGEDTSHELVKAFRKVEKIVIYNNQIKK